jgi:C4-dicarboxylate-specific signal transduction histidine kinase
MGIVVCTVILNLVMESVTRKGREVSIEPSQFHGLFRLWRCEMTKMERQVIEDVKKVLESGDEGIIETMKLNIKAYLHCIEINQRRKELSDIESALLQEREHLEQEIRRLL